MDISAETQHLVSYFAACGLDKNRSLEALPYNREGPPLCWTYRASVLCHFPDEREGVPFNGDAVMTLSLPNGIVFKTRSKLPKSSTSHSFVTTREDGHQSYGVVLELFQLVKDQAVVESFKSLQDAWVTEHSDEGKELLWDPEAEGSDLFVSKVLVLLLDGPFVSFGRQFLEQVVATCDLPDGSDLASTHLHFLLNQVFVPHPGRIVELQGPLETLYCRSAATNDLPLVDFPIKFLLQRFSLDDILTLFKCVLLECQILLVSTELDHLTTTAELLCSLIFPFQWQNVYAPIMPAHQNDLLDAPVPFIMGKQVPSSDPSVVSRDAFDLEDEICMVNIDRGTIDVQVCQNILLPKVKLLEGDLAELFSKNESFRSLDEKRATSISERPLASNSLSVIADGDALFDRGMELICSDKCMPQPSVRMRSRIQKQPATTLSVGKGLAITEEDSSQVKNGSAPTENSLAQLRRLARIANEVGLKTSYSSLVSPPSERSQPENDSPSWLQPLTRSSSDNTGGAANAVRNAGTVGSLPVSDSPLTEEQSMNHAVQTVFVSYFVTLLKDYELYLLEVNCNSFEEWLKERESMVSFDKVAFLSDQPAHLKSFFEMFVDTQMFTVFVDSRVLSQWVELPNALVVFHKRLNSKYAAEDIGDNLKNSSDNPFKEVGFMRRRTVMPRAATQRRGKKLSAANSVVNPSFFQSAGRTMSLKVRPLAARHSIAGDTSYEIPPPQVVKSPLIAANGVTADGRRAITPTPCVADSSDDQLDCNGIDDDDDDLLRPSWMTHVKIKQGTLGDGLSGITSQTTIVRRLLREGRVKIKRLLVHKMGREAYMLGHGEEGGSALATGIEENTLITNLCDLLERVWAHGCIRKVTGKKAGVQGKGKSFLWLHLKAYADKHDLLHSSAESNGTEVAELSKGGRRLRAKASSFSVAFQGRHSVRSSPVTVSRPRTSASVSSISFSKLRRSSMKSSVEPPREMLRAEEHIEQLRSLEAEKLRSHRAPLLQDISAVRGIKDIKTDIGFARAFIRMALEKKILHQHMEELLNDEALLCSMYREYAFLRCDDEREQFLFHLLSLTTIELCCFTSCYTTKTFYTIAVLGSDQFYMQQFTASLQLYGSISVSKLITLPAQTTLYSVECNSIGVLEGMVVTITDPSNSAVTSRIQGLFVITSLTGACYSFSAKDWRTVDDSSSRLLLVAHPFPMKSALQLIMRSSGQRRGSFSLSSSLSLPNLKTQEEITPRVEVTQAKDLREVFAENINLFAKYKDGGSETPLNITNLLWGQNGFCQLLCLVLAHGMKVQRMFRSKRSVWHVLEQVTQGKSVVWTTRREFIESNLSRELTSAWRTLKEACDKVAALPELGKQNKCYHVICIGVRKHVLSSWVEVVGFSDACEKLYEPNALMRDPDLLGDIVALTEWLVDLEFDFPPAILDCIKGI